MDPPLQQLDTDTPPLTPTSLENSMFDADGFDFQSGVLSDAFIGDYTISPQKAIQTMPTPMQSDTEEDSVFSSEEFRDYFAALDQDLFTSDFGQTAALFQEDRQDIGKIDDYVCLDHTPRNQPMAWEGFLKINSGDPCLSSVVVEEPVVETPQKITERRQRLYQEVMEVAAPKMVVKKSVIEKVPKDVKAESRAPSPKALVPVNMAASSADHEYCANIPDTKGSTPTPPPSVSFKIEMAEKRTATVHTTYPKGIPCGSLHTTLHSGSVQTVWKSPSTPLSCVSTQSSATPRTVKPSKRRAVISPVVEESQSKVAKLETKAVAERNRRKKSNLLLTNLADTLEGVTPEIFNKVSKKGPSKKFVIDSAYDTLAKLKTENRGLHSTLSRMCAETEELLQTLRKNGVQMPHAAPTLKRVKQSLLR